MDKKQLVRIVKEIVRKEVRAEISLYADTLEEDMKKAFKEVLIEVVNGKPSSKSVQPKKTREKEEVRRKNPTKQSSLEWNTGNVVLDSILSETTHTIPQEGGMAQPGLLVEDMDVGVRANDPGIPEEVGAALTRDYRELMNKIEEKKRGVS